MNKIAPNYRIVDDELVWISKTVTDFTIPVGVTSVSRDAIHDRIRRIVFPDSVKSFYIPEDNMIEEIVLPSEIWEYETSAEKRLIWGLEVNYNMFDYGLGNLRRLKSVAIPKQHHILTYYGLPHYEEVRAVIAHFSPFRSEKVIVRYDSSSELLSKNMEEAIMYAISCLRTNGNAIEFVGPKVYSYERRQIKKKIKKDLPGIKIIFSQPVVKEFKDEKEVVSVDSEIQSLFDEIEAICNKLPGHSRKIVMDRVNSLLSNYNIELEKLKPNYTRKRDITELKLGDVKFLRAKLLSDLAMIKISLSSEKVLINLLSKIEVYKGITYSNITEETKEQSVTADVKNIVYLSNMFDDKRRTEILDRLRKVLDLISSKVSSQLSSLNNNMEPVLETIDDYQKDLEVEIRIIYDECNVIFEKVLPYRRLYDCLCGNNTNMDDNDNTIIMDVNKVRFCLSKLSDGKHKNKLEEEFNILFNKYRNRIEKILDDNTLLEQSNYEELEKEFREELHPLLEEINRYARLDKYEATTANKANIQNQLLKSLELISHGKVIRMNRQQKQEMSLEAITSFVVEIYNEVISNDDISIQNKKVIINDLEDTLNGSIIFLKSKSVNSIKEYNEVLSEILNGLAKIKINLIEYINDLSEYNVHSK